MTLAGGLGRVLFSASPLPVGGSPSNANVHVLLRIGDPLGSTSSVIDKETSELVERVTYQPYGRTDSDFRSERWASYRDPNRFTGKEDEIEVGLMYFGARYYSPQLGRWMSPDPLTVHAAGADLNPYAYVGGRVFGAVDPTGLEDSPATDPTPGQSNKPLEDLNDLTDGGAPMRPGTVGFDRASGGGVPLLVGLAAAAIGGACAVWCDDLYRAAFGKSDDSGSSGTGTFKGAPPPSPSKAAQGAPKTAPQGGVTASDFGKGLYDEVLQAYPAGSGVAGVTRIFAFGNNGSLGYSYGEAVGFALSLIGPGLSKSIARGVERAAIAAAERAAATAIEKTAATAAGEAALAAAGDVAGATSEPMVTLFHGSRSWVGRAFDLARAIAGKRAGTPDAGIYLTDDAVRAATQYGRGGSVIVTRVPASFAQRTMRTGPTGKIEYFINTEADTAILNQNIQVFDTMEFLRTWHF